ncbi:MAG: LysM peptidoglycan-binding domain-containing protein [Peptococcaceae bacterium]|nr:LysM peptidoglycan-binding domain-containing protein [Peptococcaceae bacterium]
MSWATRLLFCFFVLAAAIALPCAAQAATHTVLPDECLYSISQSYGISVESLVEANQIEDNLIFPGQELNIPEEAASASENPGETSPAGADSPTDTGSPAGADSQTDSQPGDGGNTGDAGPTGSTPDTGPTASNPVYIVQPGDTLYQIALKRGLLYQEIMSANGLKDTNIYPGMPLYIPGSGGDTPVRQPVQQVNRGLGFIRPSPDEVDLLARLITAEADSEPYEGKVAVGAVVLNRVNSPGFPKSIKDVINQNGNGVYQFQPVENGWINRPASEDAKLAAREALGGTDPTNGALYFYANQSKSVWLRERPVSKTIGNTIFAY